MAPHLVITRRLPEAVETRAKSLFDPVINASDIPWNAATFLRQMDGADGLLPCVADQLGADLIRQLPASVRIIANFGVGTDHIDLEAAAARGIVVTNTPGVLTGAAADLTLLLILGATRRAAEGMRQIADTTWPGWSPTHLLGQGLQGKRLGIVGMGRIGQAVAARARAFGLEVHYHNRSRLKPAHEADARFHTSFESLLAVSDILSLHCAASPETRHMIDEGAIAQLPKGAVLINTARGDIVDDDAVIAALNARQLSAIGLDVFRGEPDIDPRYRALPTAFLLPHLGSATIEARTAMGMVALDNLDTFFQGNEPPHRIV